MKFAMGLCAKGKEEGPHLVWGGELDILPIPIRKDVGKKSHRRGKQSDFSKKKD